MWLLISWKTMLAPNSWALQLVDVGMFFNQKFERLVQKSAATTGRIANGKANQPVAVSL